MRTPRNRYSADFKAKLALEVYHGLCDYFQYYNWERRHQGLDYRTPAAVYHE